ncbi:CvpA family protein, partial [Mesorhizobium sp. M4A.F.Ca.ET.029.04.2.1]
KYTHKGAPAAETPAAPGATTDQPAAEPPANGDDADAPVDDNEGEAPADNAPTPAPATPAPAN